MSPIFPDWGTRKMTPWTKFQNIVIWPLILKEILWRIRIKHSKYFMNNFLKRKTSHENKKEEYTVIPSSQENALLGLFRVWNFDVMHCRKFYLFLGVFHFVHSSSKMLVFEFHNLYILLITFKIVLNHSMQFSNIMWITNATKIMSIRRHFKE